MLVFDDENEIKTACFLWHIYIHYRSEFILQWWCSNKVFMVVVFNESRCWLLVTRFKKNPLSLSYIATCNFNSSYFLLLLLLRIAAHLKKTCCSLFTFTIFGYSIIHHYHCHEEGWVQNKIAFRQIIWKNIYSHFHAWTLSKF